MGADRLDSRDRAIVDALRQDGRIPYSKLGRMMGVSGTAIAERVSRLTDIGVIQGFHATICPQALGFLVSAVVEFSPHEGDHDATLRRLRSKPEIETVYVVAGDPFAVLLVRVGSMELLGRLLKDLSAWGRSRSMLILETWGEADEPA